MGLGLKLGVRVSDLRIDVAISVNFIMRQYLTDLLCIWAALVVVLTLFSVGYCAE